MGCTGETLTKTSINQRMTPILVNQKSDTKEFSSQITNIPIAGNHILGNVTFKMKIAFCTFNFAQHDY